MKLRPFIAALLAFWLLVGPVGTAWAAYAATPCESMGSKSQPAAQGSCCDEAMTAAACLGTCMAASPAAVTSARDVHFEVAETAIPLLSLRHATLVAPPDVAPPKTAVS